MGNVSKRKLIILRYGSFLKKTLLFRYLGGRPHLFLSDPDILKEVFIKNFDSFTDRQYFSMPEQVRKVKIVLYI